MGQDPGETLSMSCHDSGTGTKGNVGFQTQEIVLPQASNFHESSYLRSH
jgi:hypothetical protein